MAAWCKANHNRTGIVTNQPDGYDSTRSHCSVTICDRPECLAKAIKYVAGNTNETAVYSSDESRGIQWVR